MEQAIEDDAREPNDQRVNKPVLHHTDAEVLLACRQECLASLDDLRILLNQLNVDRSIYLVLFKSYVLLLLSVGRQTVDNLPDKRDKG